VDQVHAEETAAESTEVEVAALIARGLDDTEKGRLGSQSHQRDESARGADIAGREHVRASQAAQQHQRGTPRPDAWKLAERLQRIGGRQLGDPRLGQLAGLDRPSDAAKRLGLSRTETAST
jgi:hypothetical protein